MSNPNKQKGAKFESDVVNFLKENGHPDARRVVQAGQFDHGDIHVGDFALQAKAWRNMLDGISAGVLGAEVQKENAGLPFGAAVIKRPRKSIGDSYVVMTLSEFTKLLSELS